MRVQGHITPSRFADMMQRGKGKNDKYGTKAIAYANELVLQRLGVVPQELDAWAVRWGREYETEAITEAEKTLGFIEPAERVVHPTYDFVSGEPDGLVGREAIVEVKCPYNSSNHLANIRNGEQIEQYMYQMQGYLWLTGRQLCYFVSYDPRFPAPYKISIRLVERNQAMIDEIEKRVIEFNGFVNQIMQELS
jgi:predicted phage-related endonuclease